MSDDGCEKREMALSLDKPVSDKAAVAGRSQPFPVRQRGKVGWILLWLIGIPVPVLLGLFLLRGCT